MRLAGMIGLCGLAAIGALLFRRNPTMKERGPGQQYYKSWVSYQIPMQPTGPISYAETEPLASFYLGDHDANGKLTRFIKYLVRRERLGTHPLPAPQPRGAVLYLEVSSSGAIEWASAASAYETTKGKPVFCRAVVDATGSAADIERISRTEFFRDEYEYWPGGKLRTRVMHKQDGTVVRTNYDPSGAEVGPAPARE